MKHFIVTRFYCTKLGNIDIYDENVLQRGYENMIKWFIPSLNNQSLKDFILVFLIADDANMNGINGKLKNIGNICDFPTTIVRVGDFDRFLTINSKPGTKNLISRTDCDDSLIRNIVYDTRINILKNQSKYDISFYGYTCGFQQNIQQPYKLNTFDVNWYGHGSFSIMQSLLLDYGKIRIHPYLYNHVWFVRYMQERGIARNRYSFKVEKKRRMFIRNYTGMNASCNSEERLPYDAGKPTGITRDQIRKQFGV